MDAPLSRRKNHELQSIIRRYTQSSRDDDYGTGTVLLTHSIPECTETWMIDCMRVHDECRCTPKRQMQPQVVEATVIHANLASHFF